MELVLHVTASQARSCVVEPPRRSRNHQGLSSNACLRKISQISVQDVLERQHGELLHRQQTDSKHPNAKHLLV
eukprot:6456231-Amphidinium_carterae.1